MSITLTSPVAGSILMSLPTTDWSAGMVMPSPQKTWSVDALAGAVGLLDRRQDDLDGLQPP